MTAGINTSSMYLLKIACMTQGELAIPTLRSILSRTPVSKIYLTDWSVETKREQYASPGAVTQQINVWCRISRSTGVCNVTLLTLHGIKAGFGFRSSQSLKPHSPILDINSAGTRGTYSLIKARS
jgi:hypothetical protein